MILNVPFFRIGRNASLGKPVKFQFCIVVIVDIVNSNYNFAFFEEFLGEVKTNKTGCTGNQNLHLIYVTLFVQGPNQQHRLIFKVVGHLVFGKY